MKPEDVADTIGNALRAVKEHAVGLRARLDALRVEEDTLVRDGHAIEMAPLPWSDRIRLLHEQIDETGERYAFSASQFLRQQGVESIGSRRLNFLTLQPENDVPGRVEPNIELQWGAQCYFSGDATKKKLAGLLKILQGNGVEEEGLPLTERKAKLAEIAARLAAIKAERENLFEELRGLSVSVA